MFFELLLSNEPFYILLGSDSIHGSSDSFIFGKKARTRSSLKIRDSTRHYTLLNSLPACQLAPREQDSRRMRAGRGRACLAAYDALSLPPFPVQVYHHYTRGELLASALPDDFFEIRQI
jgi:hypothetical protein